MQDADPLNNPAAAMPARKIFCTVASPKDGHNSEILRVHLLPNDLIDAGQTMRGIFDAVTFRQQRSWLISSSRAHQATLVLSRLLPQFAISSNCRCDVADWHKTDMCGRARDVGCWGQSGHDVAGL